MMISKLNFMIIYVNQEHRNTIATFLGVQLGKKKWTLMIWKTFLGWFQLQHAVGRGWKNDY